VRVLGIDTTGPHCQVALRDGERIVAHTSERIGRGHAERLAPMVADLLGDIPPASLDRVIVTTGPGSFTGLRVGLSFAVGLGLPHSIPVLGFTTLHIAAHASPHPTAAFTQDVRRGETALLSKTAGHIPALEVLPTEDALERAANAPHHISDPVPDLIAATDLALTASPAEFPPTAFYARPPDAKLPGGIDPPKAHAR